MIGHQVPAASLAELPLTTLVTRHDARHKCGGQVGYIVRGAAASDVRFGISDAGLEQARRFRCCCNQDAGLRTEPQAKLQLIPDIRNNPAFNDLWGQCRAAPAHYRRNTASAFPRLRPFLLTGLTDPRRNARKNKGVISGFSVSLIMCTGCAVSLLGDLVVTSAESKPSPLHPGGGFLLISACRFECVGPEVAAP